jgi:hypothetical protein
LPQHPRHSRKLNTNHLVDILLNSNAHVEVLHATEPTVGKPVRGLGDDGLERSHPGLGGVLLEDNVDVGLRDERSSRLSKLSNGADGCKASRQGRSDGGRRRGLTVHMDGCELAVAQDRAPEVVHGGTGAVLEDAAAEEAIAVADVSNMLR